MDQRKRSKDEEDQEQRKWPRWIPWNKGRNETYIRTEKEKQFLDMNEVQQELDLLQVDLLQDKDYTGKDDQTIEDKHKEEVQKVEEEDQKVEEEDQKVEEEDQKEEEEVQK